MKYWNIWIKNGIEFVLGWIDNQVKMKFGPGYSFLPDSAKP